MIEYGYSVETHVPVYGILVDWPLINDTGISPSQGSCVACSLPLENIINQFAIDSLVAGAFAVNFLVFLLSAGLLFWGWTKAEPRRRTTGFFGLRIALGLFVLYVGPLLRLIFSNPPHRGRFFAWLYAAVPNAQPVKRGYLVFYVFPSFMSYASDAVLVWTLSRMVTQPFVISRGYTRGRGIGLGFGITYGVFAFAAWAYSVAMLGLLLAQTWGGTFASGGALGQSGFVGSLVAALGSLWGFVFIGFAADALRKTAASLDPACRPALRLLVGAAVVWTLRSLVEFFSMWGFFFGESAAGGEFIALLNTLWVGVLGLLLLALLSFAQAEQYSPLWATMGKIVPDGAGPSFEFESRGPARGKQQGQA